MEIYEKGVPLSAHPFRPFWRGIHRAALIFGLSCTAFLFALPRSAAAITAGDIVDKMPPKEQSAFVSGAVEMASQLYARNGDRKKADCAVDWYYRTKGSVREVMGVLENYKDKEAVALIEVLINRHCGK